MDAVLETPSTIYTFAERRQSATFEMSQAFRAWLCFWTDSMAVTSYPKRDSHFAHKAFRLLHKTCFAATDGLDAFALVAVIVHTEDAARYAGPVSFWNSQLQETLGFAKWDRLDRARKKAIAAGWLNYVSSGKRQIGQYFVTIPDGCGVLSDAILEPLYPAEGYSKGYQDGYSKGVEEGIKRGSERGGAGYKEGEPSNPVPVPFPIPTVYTPGEDMVIPPKVNTPEILAAVGRWIAFLTDKAPEKCPWSNSTQEQGLFSTLGRWDSNLVEARIDECIGNGWLNLRPPESPRKTNGNGKPQGKSILDFIPEDEPAEARNEQF